MGFNSEFKGLIHRRLHTITGRNIRKITDQIVKITQFIITTLHAVQREHNRYTICCMFRHLSAIVRDYHTEEMPRCVVDGVSIVFKLR